MELEHRPELRASDADRDRVAEVLGDALAEGRLAPEEHAERLDLLYAAKTYAELEPLTSDLPGQAAATPSASVAGNAPLPPPARGSDTIFCLFSGAERKGRWLAEPLTTVTCVFGGLSLDYRNAVLPQREVVVNVTCVFGGVDVTVPPGVRIESSVSAVFGGTDDPKNDTIDPRAPVIRFTGFVLFGGISFTRKLHREQREALKAQRRLLKAERREARRQRRAL